MDASVIKEIQDKLDLFINKKGLRKTPQRDAIVEIVFSRDEHFTAEELYDRVRKANSNASRATLYRTLSLLEEAGLLHEIDLGGDHKTYDPNFLDSPSHNHLICIDCGRIEACCETLRTKGVCKDLIQARLESKRLPKK